MVLTRPSSLRLAEEFRPEEPNFRLRGVMPVIRRHAIARTLSSRPWLSQACTERVQRKPTKDRIAMTITIRPTI